MVFYRAVLYEILKAILLTPAVALFLFGPLLLADYFVNDNYGFLLGLPIVLLFIWIGWRVHSRRKRRSRRR